MSCTFLIGPSKSGKTSICHAISDSRLSIEFKNRIGYQLSVADEPDGNRQIGILGDSCTTAPSYYCEDQVCDFPGLCDTRGDDANVMNYISLLNELKKYEFIRIAICVEESSMTVCNASQFALLTDEIISLLNFSEADLSGVCLIVTKSSEEYYKFMAEDFEFYFPERKNFIIEAIKQQKMEVKIFAEPINNECSYELNPSNVSEIKQTLLSGENLESNKLQINIEAHLRSKLEKISELGNRSNIIFVSKLPRPELREIKGMLVCIDNDINLEGETLTIDAPTVIVLHDTRSTKKRRIELRGENPRVCFKNVKTFLNGKNLIVSTTSSQYIEFPDPTDESFETNELFFRIESLCLNSNRTEYATLTYKYLDLIAFIKPDFGSIEVDENFKIITDTTCIQLKLYENECTRTKTNIAERFKSLKMCLNAEKFLEGRIENTKVKDALLHYAINLPTIFELLMKDPFKFGLKKDEINKLANIQSDLISKYLDLISDCLKDSFVRLNRIQDITEALNNFLKEFNSSSDKFENHLERIKYRVIESFRNNETTKIKSFYEFYNILNDKITKDKLFNYNITGDISEYLHFNPAKAKIGTIANYKVYATKEKNQKNSPFLAKAIAYIVPLVIDKLIAKMKSRYFQGQKKIAGYKVRAN